MMRWVAFVLLSGCSSILGIDDFKVGDAATGNMDGDMGYCLGPSGWRVCLPAAPTNAPVMINSSLMFDTMSSPLCAAQQPPSWKAAGQPDACFIISTQVTFAAPMVQAIGARPLVVFASETISVNTQLDVASHGGGVPMSRGPASPSSLCVAPMAAGNATSTGGGGAGGSFTTKGGDGGNSTNGTVGGRASALDATGPTVLRAGCNGGIGGNSAELGGAPGAGGGAVYLVAGDRITISGFINASGSAGQGGQRNAGGGGGGSGGMIHLNAPMITGNGGVLVANGGGGGEGGDTNVGGLAGTDPPPQMPGLTPVGGNGNSIGGAGGNGYASVNATAGAAGPPGAVGAGGGGGGASGFIRANVMPSQVTTSPPIVVVP